MVEFKKCPCCKNGDRPRCLNFNAQEEFCDYREFSLCGIAPYTENEVKVIYLEKLIDGKIRDLKNEIEKVLL